MNVRHKSDERRVQINKKNKNKNKKKNNLPNLMNDGSKEPQKQDNYSTSSYEKNDRFCASVEVHIQNSV